MKKSRELVQIEGSPVVISVPLFVSTFLSFDQTLVKDENDVIRFRAVGHCLWESRGKRNRVMDRTTREKNCRQSTLPTDPNARSSPNFLLVS